MDARTRHEPPAHRLEAFEFHLGEPLASGARAAFGEGYRASRSLPCPYRNELAVAWRAGAHLRQCMMLRQEPSWPRWLAGQRAEQATPAGEEAPVAAPAA